MSRCSGGSCAKAWRLPELLNRHAETEVGDVESKTPRPNKDTSEAIRNVACLIFRDVLLKSWTCLQIPFDFKTVVIGFVHTIRNKRWIRPPPVSSSLDPSVGLCNEQPLSPRLEKRKSSVKAVVGINQTLSAVLIQPRSVRHDMAWLRALLVGTERECRRKSSSGITRRQGKRNLMTILIPRLGWLSQLRGAGHCVLGHL